MVASAWAAKNVETPAPTSITVVRLEPTKDGVEHARVDLDYAGGRLPLAGPPRPLLARPDLFNARVAKRDVAFDGPDLVRLGGAV